MGRIIYVGKAKRLRTRLLTYFRAEYPDDKAARILYAANDIAWDYVPSEFAAYLGELRQIRRHRPYFNFRGNVTRRSVLIKISSDTAPRIYAGATVAREDSRCYGPFRSLPRTLEAVRTLNDLLGLRDCTATMPDRSSPARATCSTTAPGRLHALRVRLLQRPLCRLRDPAGLSRASRPPRLPRGPNHPADRSGRARRCRRPRAMPASRWRRDGGKGSSSSSGSSRPPVAPGPPGICSPSCIATRANSGTTASTSSARASSGPPFPIPARPSSTRRFGRWWPGEGDRPIPPAGPLPLESLDEILLLMSWFRAHPEALAPNQPLRPVVCLSRPSDGNAGPAPGDNHPPPQS